jgi:predicted DNA-binding transcriptional regulator AlpA
MPNKPTKPQNSIDSHPSRTQDASKKTTKSVFDALPDSAWLREAHLVRKSNNLESAIAPLPFSAPTLWRMVKAGKFPKPTKLSEGVTAWQVGQVRAWMAARAMA